MKIIKEWKIYLNWKVIKAFSLLNDRIILYKTNKQTIYFYDKIQNIYLNNKLLVKDWELLTSNQKKILHSK